MNVPNDAGRGALLAGCQRWACLLSLVGQASLSLAGEPQLADSGLQRLPPPVPSASSRSPLAAREPVSFVFRLQPSADEEYPVSGDPSGMANRLQALEEKFASFERGRTADDDGASQFDRALKLAVSSGHDQATMKLEGRIHIDYWAFPGDSPGVNAFDSGDPTVTPQDRFEFRRLRFGVAGSLWQTMVYEVEMEFAAGRDVEFRDAFLGWEDLPLFQTVLIGNQKQPFGLDHLNSSKFNVFLERPFVIEGDDEQARRLGIQSYGVSDDQRWNWRYGVFNLQPIQGLGKYISDHYQMEIAGRLANTCWYDELSAGRRYAHWAIAGSLARPDGSAALFPERVPNQARFRTRPEARSRLPWIDTGEIAGADHSGLLALETVVNLGPLQVVGEYQNLWLERNPGFPGQLHFHGGYICVSHFLTGEHMPWDRTTGTLARPVPSENFFLVRAGDGRIGVGWGAWQVALRWSFADYTDKDIAGGIGESLTFGLNWYWNPHARMQLNYLYGNIHDRAPVAGQTFGNYHILGTRLMVDF